jgi:hypothetical protein
VLKEEELDLSKLLIDDNTDEEVLERIATQAAEGAARAAIAEAEAAD